MAKNRKPQTRKPQINSSPEAFEDAFLNRLGVSPINWISEKVKTGSDLSSIQHLFEVLSAEIARKNNCVPQSFNRYYVQAIRSQMSVPVSQKKTRVYNKLVRDRIPELIKSSGKTCICEELPHDQYIIMLDEKLNEELAEYQRSKSLEELADLLEVMGAVVKARGYTWEELTDIRKKKRAERGGFEKRILLKEVIEG